MEIPDLRPSAVAAFSRSLRVTYVSRCSSGPTGRPPPPPQRITSRRAPTQCPDSLGGGGRGRTAFRPALLVRLSVGIAVCAVQYRARSTWPAGRIVDSCPYRSAHTGFLDKNPTAELGIFQKRERIEFLFSEKMPSSAVAVFYGNRRVPSAVWRQTHAVPRQDRGQLPIPQRAHRICRQKPNCRTRHFSEKREI